MCFLTQLDVWLDSRHVGVTVICCPCKTLGFSLSQPQGRWEVGPARTGAQQQHLMVEVEATKTNSQINGTQTICPWWRHRTYLLLLPFGGMNSSSTATSTPYQPCMEGMIEEHLRNMNSMVWGWKGPIVDAVAAMQMHGKQLWGWRLYKAGFQQLSSSQLERNSHHLDISSQEQPNKKGPQFQITDVDMLIILTHCSSSHFGRWLDELSSIPPILCLSFPFFCLLFTENCSQCHVVMYKHHCFKNYW